MCNATWPDAAVKMLMDGYQQRQALTTEHDTKFIS